MLNLFYSYDLGVDDAYIITVKNNENSESLSKRCQQSCEKVGMPYKIWDAYDGMGEKIIEPEHLKDDSFMRLLKVTDHYMTRGEVACALSHISLWLHCAKLDKPIVILEHDAIMLKKLENQLSYNAIVYLGGAEWVKENWPVTYVPPHASDGHNYHFICRAHAYCIDPAMAKNLLSHVLKVGICSPLDIMMRADLFNITHQGVYAYDEPVGTTILSRPQEGRTTKRNENLSW
jgi:GR25 family glycosyltransferase involved in LPS biosynthesis